MKNLIRCLVFVMFILTPSLSVGQQLSGKDGLFKLLSDAFRAPREMPSCTTFAGAVVVSVKNNAIDANLVYSANFPEPLKREVKRCLEKINKKDFASKYFGLKNSASFCFLLPIIMFPFGNCEHQEVPMKEFISLVSDGFNIEIKKPVYNVKPLIFSHSEPRP